MTILGQSKKSILNFFIGYCENYLFFCNAKWGHFLNFFLNCPRIVHLPLLTTTKSVPMLKPEHGFCQQNKPEPGQVQEWYTNEKMVVVLVCLNGRCCSSGCVGIALTHMKAWVSTSSSFSKRYCHYDFSEILRER